MAKRSYTRRTDEELIAELESKIKRIEQRVESRKRADSPVLKEIPKVKRKLAQFSQLCVDHGRKDLSNSILAFLSTLEQQARQNSNGPPRPRSMNGEA